MEPGIKITLTAKHVQDCPMYEVGQKMTLAPPAIVKEETDAICVHALDCFGAWMESVEREMRSDKPELRTGESLTCFECPAALPPGAKHASVTFETGVTGDVATVQAAASPTAAAEQSAFAVKVLSGIRIFQGLSKAALEQIVPYFEVKPFKPGDTILELGQPGQAFYVIIRGQADVIAPDSTGEPKAIATMKAGECFGEMSLLTGQPVSATIRAKGTVVSLAMGKDALHTVLQRFPPLSLHFIDVVAERLRRATAAAVENLDKGMVGDLKMVSVPDLVQSMGSAAKTGILRFERRGARAEVKFGRGQVYEVKCGDLAGEAAFFELVGWEDGTFRFQETPPPAPGAARQIELSTMQLLLRAALRRDEKQAGVEAPPAPAPKPETPAASKHVRSVLDDVMAEQPPGAGRARPKGGGLRLRISEDKQNGKDQA